MKNLKNRKKFINEKSLIDEDDIFITSDMVSNGKFIKGTFPEKIKGSFYCANKELTSLEGGPIEVHGYFDCADNELTSLEGGPIRVDGAYYCAKNKLTSLEGAPTKITDHFDPNNNKLPLSVERLYIKSPIDRTNYWMGLLKYMIEQRIELAEVKGWPEGFLTNDIIKSTKGLTKFKL